MTRENIVRYLRSQTSETEAKAINDYLDQHPEEIDRILSDDEWEQFQADGQLDPEKSIDLWQRIERDNELISKKKIFHLRPLLAAASIIAVISVGWWLFSKPDPSKQAGQDFVRRLVQNTGKDTMLVNLPDNSSVQLLPQSSVGYAEPFQNDKREVLLKGEAFFEVTKDSLKPFFVYSEAISTKVLGTHFSVTAFEKENTIKVALFSGHVVVEDSDVSHPVLKTRFDLLPGDVLLYDKTKLTAGLILSNKTNIAKKRSIDVIKSSLSENHLDNNWYMFNNQALDGVFEQLQVLYNEKINYSEEDIKGLSYIGKIDKKDSLKTVLEEIGKLNNLEVSKGRSGYTIRKKK